MVRGWTPGMTPRYNSLPQQKKFRHDNTIRFDISDIMIVAWETSAWYNRKSAEICGFKSVIHEPPAFIYGLLDNAFCITSFILIIRFKFCQWGSYDFLDLVKKSVIKKIRVGLPKFSEVNWLYDSKKSGISHWNRIGIDKSSSVIGELWFFEVTSNCIESWLKPSIKPNQEFPLRKPISACSIFKAHMPSKI